MVFVDAHCHLERATYGAELEAVIERAEAAGVAGFIAVGASGVSEGAQEAVALARGRPNVYAAAGVHPHEAAAAADDARHFAVIDTLLADAKTVALGEVGLDYYYDRSPRATQRDVFAQFLAMAQKHDKPIMLHVREAHADCCDLIDRHGLPSTGGVVHCFTGGPAEARAYLDRGLYLSIPGVVTFKTAEPLREALREIPRDRIFLETDCPYLTPVPHRGKRNEPMYLPHTAAAVAEIMGLSVTELGACTTANAVRFFGLDSSRLHAGGD